MGLPDALSDAERQRLERLALADWSEAAEAHVHSIIVSGRKAAVNLLLNGDYEYSVYFQQDERGHWHDAGSSSGHADRSMLEAIDDRPSFGRRKRPSSRLPGVPEAALGDTRIVAQSGPLGRLPSHALRACFGAMVGLVVGDVLLLIQLVPLSRQGEARVMGREVVCT